MQGAIAAGSRITAEAGASVLADGGNAVDACIAAAFAAAVAEGPLTGPTGGGFLLGWFDGEATVLDCFFAAPSRPLGEMEELVIDFGDARRRSSTSARARSPCPGSSPGSRRRTAASGACRGRELVRARDRARPRSGSTRPRRSASSTRSSPGSCSATRAVGGSTATPSRIETNELRRRRSSGPRRAARSAVAELLPELADDLATLPGRRAASRSARASAARRS